ncbi:MAG TPA: YfhO family protein [Thermoanaerobaculia bacterium]|nr:YfhO family protein [Thermoanaerobaculia bacterium]
MDALDWRLLATLAVALLAVQAVCWLLARGLGLRLGRWAVAGGLLLPLVLLAPWLGGRRLLVPCDLLAEPIPGAPAVAHPDAHSLLNDTIYQFLPWELEIRHALARHQAPFWSDLLEGGSSPWANPQAGVLSPVQMAARLLPIQHHLLGALALKVLLAFEGTWLLARRLGRSRASCLLAAAGFALGGGVMSWGLFPHTAAVVWVPWLTAGLVGLFRHPRPRAIAATATITAALLLSGHPETAAIGVLFAGICGLWLRRRRTGLIKGLGAAALAGVLGLGLAAPHVLPFLEVLTVSQRAHETLALTLPVHERVSLAAPLTWFVPGHGQFVLSPTNPRAFGRPFEDPFSGPIDWADANSGYAGLVAFAGALIALLAWRDRRARPFLVFAAIALLAAGRFLPFAHLIYALPALRLLTYERFLMVGTLALALAAAAGTDRLLGYARQAALAGRAALWAALALAAAISLAVRWDPFVASLWALLALAAFLGSWVLPPRPTRWKWLRRLRRLSQPRTWAALVLALVLGLDLLPWARSLLPAGHPQLFYPKTPYMDAVASAAAAPGGPWRAVGAEYLIYPSILPFYGVAEVRPHNPLAPLPYLRVLRDAFGFDPSMVRYFSRLGNVDHPLLDFLNVRVVVSSVAMPPSRKLKLADGGRFAPFFLYENPGALPRWFLPAAVEVIRRGDLDRWIAGLSDGARVALFADEVGAWRPAPSTAPRGLHSLVSTPGHTLLALPPGLAAGTLVATSIPFSRGWRATAAGKALPTVTVDGAFLGIRVPAGAERLDLRFLPPGLIAGLIAFLLAAAGMGVLLWKEQRRAVVVS